LNRHQKIPINKQLNTNQLNSKLEARQLEEDQECIPKKPQSNRVKDLENSLQQFKFIIQCDYATMLKQLNSILTSNNESSSQQM
jgi:hypothetical protein